MYALFLGATPTGGAVRNTQQEPYAILRQPVGVNATGAVRNTAYTAYAILRTKSMSEGNIVGRASLDRITSQEEQHEGKAKFNISVKI